MKKYLVGLTILASFVVVSSVSAQATVVRFTVSTASYNPESYPNAFNVSYAFSDVTAQGVTVTADCHEGLIIQMRDDAGKLHPFSCGDIGAGGTNGYFPSGEYSTDLVFTNNTSQNINEGLLLSAYGINSVSRTVTIIPNQPQNPFKVTFPSSGATLNQGSTYKLMWSGRDNGVRSYSVYLVGGSLGSNGSRYLGTVDTENQDWFSWTVPSNIPPESGYQIQFSGAGATGDNSSSFSIAASTNQNLYPFTVTYPSAGATLKQGMIYKLLWSGRDVGVTSYSVYLVGGALGSNGSRSLGTVNTATQDWFSWTVPGDVVPSSGYQIQFSGAGATGDNSDSFSVVARSAIPPAVVPPPDSSVGCEPGFRFNPRTGHPCNENTNADTAHNAGTADIDTQASSSSCVVLTYDLRYQSRDISTNGEVSSLQDFLQSKGYLSSEPTGYFGMLTFQAVKDFQKANGISPTGFVGPITRAKIHQVSCGI
ncbi:MAG: Ser-Thr-rich GPI-anchored membrane family protein [Candidatus Pacebacteria bacterium]|nr:Ser-Thr-rich GPI-anchored membrane family protein [Candidatus Paceibacterota bacterium]MDD5357250.1 Ser-Thr-rich GPI-anchored membrane family protein [Candidatus Paceibacterota bacterium]